MTTTQLLVLTGIVYVAPHIHKEVALGIGLLTLIGAAIRGLMT